MNGETLVHFLAETVEDNYPNIVGFEIELSHVEQAARGKPLSFVSSLPSLTRLPKPSGIYISPSVCSLRRSCVVLSNLKPFTSLFHLRFNVCKSCEKTASSDFCGAFLPVSVFPLQCRTKSCRNPSMECRETCASWKRSWRRTNLRDRTTNSSRPCRYPPVYICKPTSRVSYLRRARSSHRTCAPRVAHDRNMGHTAESTLGIRAPCALYTCYPRVWRMACINALDIRDIRGARASRVALARIESWLSRFSLTLVHEFHSTAKNQVDVLVEMHKNMTTMYKDLVEYFSMDVKKTPLDEFFGDLKTFLDQYEVSRQH